MKIISFKDPIFNVNTRPNIKHFFLPNIKFYALIILVFIYNNLFLLTISKNKNIKNNESLLDIIKEEIKKNKTNIDLNNEFFQKFDVKVQIYTKNSNYIETISGGSGNIGNALIMLNNLINICEKIRCKNIISPGGLQNIIKNPILYDKFNITIFPKYFENKTNIDIKLENDSIFYFRYKRQPHEIRLNIIKEEVLNNIPKFITRADELIINIRSGDIFINIINKNYAQPPLCFYQKIINENMFKKIYILSNGHENPVVDELLKLYPKIKFIHGPIVFDISVIIYAYNLVMPISTFPQTLIHLNINLKNLYIYEISFYELPKGNYTLHKMIPSANYLEKMKRKWKNTEEQLNLMIGEKCLSDKIISSSIKIK